MKASPPDVAPAVDPADLLRKLGFKDATAITPIKGGWDTLIWRFQAGDALRSLRIYWLPDGEEALARETWALRHCESVAVPAPRVLVTDRVKGLPVAVLSWRPGLPLLTRIENSPWRLPEMARLFGRVQAHLHALPAPSPLPGHEPLHWVRLIHEDHMELAEGLLAEAPASSAFIHMDYQPMNVLVRGRRCTGVIDWAGAAVGDVRADLARTEVTLQTAPAPPGFLRTVITPVRWLVLRWWRMGYESVAGPMPDYSGFRRWAAASLLREVARVMGRPGVWAEPEYIDLLHAVAAGTPEAV